MSEYRESYADRETADAHLAKLDLYAHYLGNTVMVGISPDGSGYQQVCWLLARDDTERNRQFVIESVTHQGHTEEVVQTIREPEGGVHFKPYPVMRSAVETSREGKVVRELHVVTTGNRTQAIVNSLLAGSGRPHPFGVAGDFYDPDPTDPFKTPRVSGLLDIGIGAKSSYGRKETYVNYNILTRGKYSGVSEYPLWLDATPGVALAAHSYQPPHGAPEPFSGFPYALPIGKDAKSTRDFWWKRLPVHQRVAIAVVSIEGQRRTYAVENAD